ncbi:MAG: hypothetical protein J6S82_07675 [Bacteroidales bacterium]|nr:hypothetical protein [Bacteroidales bacterium]
MKQKLIYLALLLLPTLGNLHAQYWFGLKSIGINAGINTLFNDPLFIYNTKAMEQKDFSQKRISPVIGAFFSGDDERNSFAFGFELGLNFIPTGSSATFLKNGNTYVANIRQRNLQAMEMLYFGYIFSDQLKLSIAVGFSQVFTIGSTYELLENGAQKSMDKYGFSMFSNFNNATSIPIALRGTYFLTDQLFVKGSLGFQMINYSISSMIEHEGVFSTIGEFQIDDQSVTYQNKWKAVSFILSVGYQWE